MRGIHRALGSTVLPAVLLVCTACTPDAPTRPNVLLIVADDLGYGQVSSYAPGAEVPTPNIDRLSESGIRMTHAYATDPRCWPSRASILTGQYPQRFEDPKRIPRRNPMISQPLREAGYATAAIGKWHQGTDPADHPLEWGFDTFYGFLGGLHDYFESEGTLADFRARLEGARRPIAIVKALERSPVLDGRTEVEHFDYLTDELSDRAVSFIRDSADRPFFVYLAYNAIHRPLQAPDALLRRHADAPNERAQALRAMIEALDTGVGRVLDAVAEQDTARDTLVIFTSDNGGRVEVGSPRANASFRGGKEEFFEGGIRVPLIVRWPGGLPEGRVYDQAVSTLDILPTVIAATGASWPRGATVDGVDLLPYLRGDREGAPHDVLHWADPRSGRHALRRGRMKIVGPGEGQAPMLFDLERDPGEARDRAPADPETTEALSALHRAWSADMAESRRAAAASP